MACVTLKRPLEWESQLANGPPGPGPSSSPRAKRARFSHHHHANHLQTASMPPKEPSPFGEVYPKVTADDIAANIREEVKRLHHRKQLRMGCGSPPLSSSPLSVQMNLDHFDLNFASPSSGPHSPSSKKEQPLFTPRQVNLICERLLKERETQLREEYDKVLVGKLAEQYDTFVKFTYEQIHKRLETASAPSYLS